MKITFFEVYNENYRIRYVFKRINRKYYYYLQRLDSRGWELDSDGPDKTKWRVFKSAGWIKRELKKDEIFVMAL